MARAVRSKGRTAGDWTRSRILAAASALFAEHGYNGTSVRMVAKSLGLSDPAVHYYFPTKQMLYEALLQQPDYGALPLDGGTLTRSSVVEQVMHLFSWWLERPELGQMLLREQLAGHTSSVGFMSDSEERWASQVQAPLRDLLGPQGESTSDLLFELLAGIFWDAVLSYGESTREVSSQPYFRERVRQMVELAIPAESSVPR